MQSPGLVTNCTAFGQEIQECQDGRAPKCSTACGQKVCMSANGKKTGTILSACPKHHPQNVKNCCGHQTSKDWCTCNIQPTLDSISKVYKALGGKNTWVSASWGECGSQLEKLGIETNTTRPEKLVQPFLKTGDLCQGEEAAYAASKDGVQMSGPLCDEANAVGGPKCSSLRDCKMCTSKYDQIASQCYSKSEAEVLAHAINLEIGKGYFTCAE